MVHTILIVDDDEAIREYLKDVLLDNGYSVIMAEDGVEALKKIQKSRPDLVLLDLGLPTLGGESVCAEVKKTYPGLQVIILTARSTTPDIVKGLGFGADDYIIKPFEVSEVLARIQARLREQHASDGILQVDDLIMDTATMEVKRAEKIVALTAQEFKLLEYLLTNKGKVLTRNMILNRLWLYSPDIDTRVVDVYIGYLRKKLEGKQDKKVIHSIRGFGYSVHE